MIIHKDCYGTIFWVCLSCTALSWLIMQIPFAPLAYILNILPMSMIGFVLYFFRVPQRKTVSGDNIVTSVADGKVVVIDKVFESEYIKDECIQVSVYMDFFNVHVNFWPVSGNVSYFRYHPGKYMLAFLPKASELNEHTSTAVATPYGEILFKQIAGTFARRIVCYARTDSPVTKGDECGIIKFGSRVDIFFPLDADIKVKLGDYVKASESVIAELRK